jgi:hypothetical protein
MWGIQITLDNVGQVTDDVNGFQVAAYNGTTEIGSAQEGPFSDAYVTPGASQSWVF